MKKRLIIGAVICLSIMTIFGCGSKKSEKKDKKFEITINNDTKSFYDKIEKTDKEIPDDSKQKIEEGIQNWAKATIGIDDSFSDDTKKITDEKLYEIITSDKEREKIKQQREEFYKDSKIQTDNITVEIKKASEALYNERTIGYVEAKVTVEGKRNDDSFTNKYDLVLLMDYQEDVASVYEVVDIKTAFLFVIYLITQQSGISFLPYSELHVHLLLPERGLLHGRRTCLQYRYQARWRRSYQVQPHFY